VWGGVIDFATLRKKKEAERRITPKDRKELDGHLASNGKNDHKGETIHKISRGRRRPLRLQYRGKNTQRFVSQWTELPNDH